MRHVDEQVVGRALDALPPDEAVQVDRHVATCPACHRLLHDVQEMAHLLTLVVPPAQPPYHCKARVMERIVREGARQRSAR
jgi:anti-sigma factor RsiW